MRFRTMFARMMLIAGLLLTVAAVPSTAQAALPTCTHFTTSGAGFGRYFRDPTAGGSTQCKLQLGDYNNWGVVILQQWLQHCNNASQVAIDGDYGPITRDVITWIQAVKGIRVDGVYGPQTRSVLNWAIYDANGRVVDCARV